METVQETITGGYVMSLIGWLNERMPMTANDKYGGTIDITKLLCPHGEEENTLENIGAILCKCAFRSEVMVQDDEFRIEILYSNFVNDLQDKTM